jgi:N-acetylmuramoyl-L-alanine amidase
VLLLLSAAEAKPHSKKHPAPLSLSARIALVRKDEARISKAWYDSLQESLSSIPHDVVKGRTIVIDPGHVNLTPGAEGPRNKITEADANWGVASYLVPLLNDAGARAILTGPYGKPKPVEQRDMIKDLDRRADVANREKADLFISIHHNWAGDLAVNKLEIYYKLQDEGASRDAGNYLMIHMARNLGLDGSLMPANFRVLRVNTRPAILSEASYLSNPIQESLLVLPDKQKLEAEAIFLGILDYFAHGVPGFSLLPGSPDVTTSSYPRLRILVRDRAGLDRNTVRATFDGIPAGMGFSPTDSTCVAVPGRALTNGPHVFRFEARNTRGNAGIPFETTFVTDREPASIVLSVSPPVCPPGRFAAEVQAAVHDNDGQPVSDTRRVTFTADTTRLGDSALHAGSARVYVSRAKPGNVRISASCGQAFAATVIAFAPVSEPMAQFRVLRSSDSLPIDRVVIHDDWRKDSMFSNSDGMATLAASAGEHAFTFVAPGFRPAGLDLKFEPTTALTQNVRMEPLLAGALLDLRVSLDPAGLYDVPDTSAELSAFNLAVVRRLGPMLERSGAQVQYIRNDSLPRTRLERVTMATAFRPGYYLEVASRTRDPEHQTRIGHYPNSENGTSLADSVAAGLSTLKQVAAATLVEDHDYEITNAPCPAISVNLRFPGATAAKIRTDTVLMEMIAREMLLALARQQGAALSGRLNLHVSGPDGRPLDGARVEIDGLLNYWADAKGDVAVPGLDLGHHRCLITGPGRAPRTQDFELTPKSPAATVTAVLNPAH